MAQTYSQSLTGQNAGSRYTAASVRVGDVDASGDPVLNSGVSLVMIAV